MTKPSGMPLYDCGYAKGRADVIDEMSDKSLRYAIVNTHCELMQIFADKGDWGQLYRTTREMFEVACRWKVADEFAEQMRGETDERNR